VGLFIQSFGFNLVSDLS